PGEGRLRQGSGEIALGAQTAAERDVSVGDRVEVRGDGIEAGPRTVTGLVVMPPLGQFRAERAGPGRGAVLPAAAVADDHLARLFTFVGVDLAPDADRDAVTDAVLGMAGTDDVPIAYTQPVRPAEIIDARSMRAAPLLVGGLLAASSVAGLTAAVVVSVRARRRELATLQALGF